MKCMLIKCIATSTRCSTLGVGVQSMKCMLIKCIATSTPCSTLGVGVQSMKCMLIKCIATSTPCSTLGVGVQSMTIKSASQHQHELSKMRGNDVVLFDYTRTYTRFCNCDYTRTGKDRQPSHKL